MVLQKQAMESIKCKCGMSCAYEWKWKTRNSILPASAILGLFCGGRKAPLQAVQINTCSQPDAVILDDCGVGDNSMLSAWHFQPVSKQTARPWPTLKEAACLKSAWGGAGSRWGPFWCLFVNIHIILYIKALKLHQENDWLSVWANLLSVTVYVSIVHVCLCWK